MYHMTNKYRKDQYYQSWYANIDAYEKLSIDKCFKQN